MNDKSLCIKNFFFVKGNSVSSFFPGSTITQCGRDVI